MLGANGSGKSTLLSLIYGDLHPALGGTIERAGLSVGERIEDWKRRVAWVSPELQADHYRPIRWRRSSSLAAIRVWD